MKKLIENLDPAWLEELYLRWQADPDSLSSDWRAFFHGYELGSSSSAALSISPSASLKQSAVQSLIYRYRDIGHLLACLDPLSPCRTDHPLLTLEAFGLTSEDLDTVFHTRRYMKTEATLREILTVMRETYCHSIGVEFMHIQVPDERQWLIDRMEPTRNYPDLTGEQQGVILKSLLETTLFERFLSRKFMGQTRFSLEGGEVLIPMVSELLAAAAGQGVHEVVIGMPHRGRLNILVNVLGLPLETLFAHFREQPEAEMIGDGDVKYHIGFSTDIPQGDGHIHVTLAANPSHLEAIDPVVVGKARARQDRCSHGSRQCVLPLLIHGDAAFAGQGVVAETLNLSQLEGFGTGGTIHIVVNNQIGFTTLPKDSRSSCYVTDTAKAVMAPVFHVHGEDPEAAVHAIRLAMAYRQRFQRDVVVELICYRRYGHNEGDEPSFTQPRMYARIKDRPQVADLYARELQRVGSVEDAVSRITADYTARLEAAFNGSPLPGDTGFGGEWGSIRREYIAEQAEPSTGVAAERLISLNERLCQVPAAFSPHPKVAALLQKRLESVHEGGLIDWALAESLAFATLLADGVSIRLSGQDVRRGTFSQRHAVLFDTSGEKTATPLSSVAAPGANFFIYDSSLSEFAVVGFEYGYSLATPHDLTLWEAQYGDFVNGAQIIVDQFIASGESKWQRVSGLVMLLPHGYEGQGAEHSSARIERFLQLCAQYNMQVAYPTTPAQYFHLLRRQIKQPFRKPLIVFTPKGFLRNPRVSSPLMEFTSGSFREIIAEDRPDATTLLLCSGKIAHELAERKERDQRGEVAVIRVEQLYPLRIELLREILNSFPKASIFRWVQEEPANMGGWGYIRPLLAELLGREPQYVGRGEDAVPAVGSQRVHKIEQETVLTAALAP